MPVATKTAQRVKVVSATRASGIAWSKQLWDCELSCGHSQRVTGRSGGSPLTTTCDTCGGKPWTKRSQSVALDPARPYTYTPINKIAPGMWPINYGRKLVKSAADILYSIGIDNRKDVRAELDALQNTIRMLRESIEQMEIADERTAGDVDD